MINPANFTKMLLLGYILVCGVCVTAYKLSISDYIVDIKNNILTDVKRTNKSSDELYLSGLGLRGIDADAFSSVGELKTLDLSNNDLSTLPLIVFRSLTNLEYLSLANNEIWNVQDLFSGLTNLRILDIRNNGMLSLRRGSFHGLGMETDIISNGNHSGRITPVLFLEPFPLISICVVGGIVKSIKAFDQETTKRETENGCETKLSALIDGMVSLSFENIRGFDEGWFRLDGINATSLDLQGNSIDEISPNLLNDLPESVTKVKLAMNNIKGLKSGIIFNKNLRELDLSDNYIRVIEDNALVNTSLESLLLNGNILQSITFIKTLPSSLKQLSFSTTEQRMDCKIVSDSF